jgi:RNA polymerase sigma-70 factor (ECF subfamily)
MFRIYGNFLIKRPSKMAGFDQIPSMNSSIPVSWFTVEAATPRVPVQIDQLSNYDLVVQCQSGHHPDRDAFSELVRRYQAHIERMLYHLAPDWQDRSDLVQEVWIRVYRNIKRLQEPEKFRGWLSRIATNLFYDELRKRKRSKPPLSLDAPVSLDDGEMDWEIASDTPGPVDHMTTQEFYDQLRNAIADLPEAFRTTIVLREIQGMA